MCFALCLCCLIINIMLSSHSVMQYRRCFQALFVLGSYSITFAMVLYNFNGPGWVCWNRSGSRCEGARRIYKLLPLPPNTRIMADGEKRPRSVNGME